MKKMVLALSLVLAALFVMAGCQPKYIGYYEKSRVEELRTKTNQLEDYNIKYNMTQQIKLKNIDDTKEPVFWESVYKVENGVFKKHKGDYNKYKFTGSRTKKRPPELTNSVTEKFNQFNDGEKMHLQIDGSEQDGYPKDSNYNDSTYAVVDKLPVDFYNTEYIETIHEYAMSGSKKDYIFTYVNKPDDTTVAQKLFNSPKSAYWLPSISNVKYSVDTCQAEIILNKEGYIVKQIVTVKINIESGKYNGINTKGEATLSMKIEYVKPGSTVKL